MISPSSIDVREVVSIGDAFRSLSVLPDEVKRQAQAALNDLQNGRRPENVEYKELGNSLAGISEIKIRFNKDAFRIYNVVIYREVLYLLDAGIKKSKKGGEIRRKTFVDWRCDIRLPSRTTSRTDRPMKRNTSNGKSEGLLDRKGWRSSLWRYPANRR